MTVQEQLAKWKLEDFIVYNKRYDDGEFAGSEATKFDLDAIKYFIGVRDILTYTEDTSGDNWLALDITKGSHSKYGTNYIFIDVERQLWRTHLTGEEFYHGPKNRIRF